MPNHRTIRAFCRVPVVVISLAFAPGCAGTGGDPLGELMSAAGATLQPTGALDDQTVVAGLKEALRVGTDRSVNRASQLDGYYRNPQIRIPLPDQLDKVASSLRAIGMGAQVDELELTMNRAAEKAATEAAPVFVDAITQMSFADARAILQGNERAATDYFEGRTRPTLADRFSPIVEQSMNEVGLVRVYDDVVGRVAALPLVPVPTLDLRSYVTDSALDGLFTLLAQEEGRIRQDPAARTTQLLKTVFGQ